MPRISASMLTKGAWSLTLVVIGCVVGSSAAVGCSGSRAANDGLATGEMRAALTADVLSDVASVAYTVVDADDECDAEAIAEATSPIEEEGLPVNLQPDGGGDNHAFADALFVLDPGSYRVCAQPLDASGEPSSECEAVEGTADVEPGEMTEILLVSQCEGVSSGALDVVTALNHPPHIDDLVVRPSKFIRTCEEATLLVMASDPNGDALSYEWELVSGPSGTLDPDGDSAVFTPGPAGDYGVTVTVTDVYGATTDLSIVVHVSEAEDCETGSCEQANGLLWCYDPNVCGNSCDDLCGSFGLTPVADDAVWFAAQDTPSECQSLADAFGFASTPAMAPWTYGCAELRFHDSTLLCSTSTGCAAAHRTNADDFGQDCATANHQSICPCE